MYGPEIVYSSYTTPTSHPSTLSIRGTIRYVSIQVEALGVHLGHVSKIFYSSYTTPTSMCHGRLNTSDLM